jgi:hypothetical protein
MMETSVTPLRYTFGCRLIELNSTLLNGQYKPDLQDPHADFVPYADCTRNNAYWDAINILSSQLNSEFN